MSNPPDNRWHNTSDVGGVHTAQSGSRLLVPSFHHILAADLKRSDAGATLESDY